MFLVELEKDCWVADWDGDPGRTVVKKNAQRFRTQKSAEKALGKARTFRPFKRAVITSPK